MGISTRHPPRLRGASEASMRRSGATACALRRILDKRTVKWQDCIPRCELSMRQLCFNCSTEPELLFPVSNPLCLRVGKDPAGTRILVFVLALFGAVVLGQGRPPDAGKRE